MLETLPAKQLIQIGFLICLAMISTNIVISAAVSVEAYRSHLYSSFFSLFWTGFTCLCSALSGSVVCLSTSGATPKEVGVVIGSGYALTLSLFMLL